MGCGTLLRPKKSLCYNRAPLVKRVERAQRICNFTSDGHAASVRNLRRGVRPNNQEET